MIYNPDQTEHIFMTAIIFFFSGSVIVLDMSGGTTPGSARDSQAIWITGDWRMSLAGHGYRHISQQARGIHQMVD